MWGTHTNTFFTLPRVDEFLNWCELRPRLSPNTRYIALEGEKLSTRIRSSVSIGLHTTTTIAAKWVAAAVALNQALHI